MVVGTIARDTSSTSLIDCRTGQMTHIIQLFGQIFLLRHQVQHLIIPLRHRLAQPLQHVVRMLHVLHHLRQVLSQINILLHQNRVVFLLGRDQFPLPLPLLRHFKYRFSKTHHLILEISVGRLKLPHRPLIHFLLRLEPFHQLADGYLVLFQSCPQLWHLGIVGFGQLVRSVLL